MNKQWRFTRLLALALVVIVIAVGCSKTPQQPYPTEQSNMLLEQGVQAHQQGRYTEAIYLFEQASTHFRSIDHQAELTLALLNLAETAYLVGTQERAYRVAHDAADLAKANEAMNLYWRAKLLLARIQFEQDNAPHALEYVDEFFQSHDKASPLYFNALVLRADIAFQQEPSSTHWLEQVHALPINKPLYKARVLRLNALYHAVSSPHLAEQELTAAYDIYQRLAFRPGIASTLTQFSEFYAAQERHKEAKQAGVRALHIRAWLNDVERTRQLLNHLANLSQLEGNQAWVEKARQLAWELKVEPSHIRNPAFLEVLN